jgi:hypothetical protein
VFGKKKIKADNQPTKEGRIVKKDVVVFAFFLFLSFIFWYLNSLGKEIEADIKYPVTYINAPDESEVIADQTVRLDLSLRGPGFLVMKLKLFGGRSPIEIDISRISYRKVSGSTSQDYFILIPHIYQEVAAQLRSECQITSLRPDTLFFSLKEKDTGNSVEMTEGER